MGKTLIIKDADFSTNGIKPEFERLEWIGVSDDYRKYISSGITLKTNTKFYIEFTTIGIDTSFPNENSRGIYLGAQMNNRSVLALWFTAKNNNGTISQSLSIGYGNSSTTNSDPYWKIINRNILDGNFHTLEVTPNGYSFDNEINSWPDNTWGIKENYGNPVFYLDSSSRGTPATNNDWCATKPDFLRIHRIKIYEGDTIVFDAIPVKRTIDNKIGYYDFVSNTYKFRNDDSTPVNSLS